NFTIVDLGTGSGVIAITLAKHFKNALIYATDISKEALKLAKDNALSHGVTIQFYEGDFLEPFIDRKIKIDLLISNPAYIDYADLPSLSDTVKECTPHLASVATTRGVGASDVSVHQVLLRPDHPQTVYCEIGYKRGVGVDQLFEAVIELAQAGAEDALSMKDVAVTVRFQVVR